MATLIYIAHPVRGGSDHKHWIRTFYQVLIFSFLPACDFNNDAEKNISVKWKENLATGLVIPRGYIPGLQDDSIPKRISIHLFKEGNQPAVLGDFQVSANEAVFTSLIPLTRGFTYEVLDKNKSLGKIHVPISETDESPEVIAVYPSQDTLPENLLKIYIKFSSPMQEDQAMNHVFLVKNESDTISFAFLPLQQELWNRERTILTVWLHPGRIKRDLQPNKKLGTPLVEGIFYHFIISPEWRDIHGALLHQSFIKKFAVVSRDSLSPDTENWLINNPVAESKNALELKFDEPLVYTLIQESIEIYNLEQKLIGGNLEVLPDETGVSFTPTFNWKKGGYLIRIQSRLEDLAGNNLNRAFDQDISVEKTGSGIDFFEIRFEIK